MSTERGNTAIAPLVAEVDGKADSEDLADDIMSTISGTDIVDQSGSLPSISGESRLNSAVLAADSGHSSESNFSGDSKRLPVMNSTDNLPRDGSKEVLQPKKITCGQLRLYSEEAAILLKPFSLTVSEIRGNLSSR